MGQLSVRASTESPRPESLIAVTIPDDVSADVLIEGFAQNGEYANRRARKYLFCESCSPRLAGGFESVHMIR